MMINLDELNEMLSDPHFFNFLNNLDIDAVLDMRDESSFCELWMKEFHMVEAHQDKISHSDLALINKLREKAFKLSYRIAEHSELSSYISDDIELMAKNITLNLHDSWAINDLLKAYQNGEFSQLSV